MLIQVAKQSAENLVNFCLPKKIRFCLFAAYGTVAPAMGDARVSLGCVCVVEMSPHGKWQLLLLYYTLLEPLGGCGDTGLVVAAHWTYVFCCPLLGDASLSVGVGRLWWLASCTSGQPGAIHDWRWCWGFHWCWKSYWQDHTTLQLFEPLFSLPLWAGWA